MNGIESEIYKRLGFRTKIEGIEYAKRKGIKYPRVNNNRNRNQSNNLFINLLINELEKDYNDQINDYARVFFEGVEEQRLEDEVNDNFRVFFELVEEQQLENEREIIMRQREEERLFILNERQNRNDRELDFIANMDNIIAQYNNKEIDFINVETKDARLLLRVINLINIDDRDTLVGIKFEIDKDGNYEINEQYYTVNDKLMNKLIEFVNNMNNINHINDRINDRNRNHDNDFQYETIFMSLISFEISRRNAILAREFINEGAAFNYKLKVGIFDDKIVNLLARYQIYLDDDKYIDKVNEDDNCLIHSLKLYNIPEDQLNFLKERCRSGKIPSKVLKIFGEKFNYRIIIQKDNDRYLKYGIKNGKKINLGLLNKHYFIIEQTLLTSFSIKNYEKIKKQKEWWLINKIKNKGNKQYFEKSKKGSNSYNIIKELLSNSETFLIKNGLNSLDMKLFNKKIYDITGPINIKNDDPKDIELIIPHHEKCKLKKNLPDQIKEWLNMYEKYKLKINIFFDFEANTDTIINKNHEAYMVCYYIYVNDELYEDGYFEQSLCEIKFLQHISNISKQIQKDHMNKLKIGFIKDIETYMLYNKIFVKRNLIAHNISYDFQFILNYMDDLELVKRSGNKICGGTASYNKIKFNLKDSYALMPIGLYKFPEFFKFDDKNIRKEVIPYKLYNNKEYTEVDYYEITYVNYNKIKIPIYKYCKIDEAKKILEEELLKKYSGNESIILNKLNGTDIEDKVKKDIEIFEENIKIWKLEKDNDCFDQMAYARIYCKKDVEVMAKGYYTFRDWNLKYFKEDIDEYLTISSLANGIITNNFAYSLCTKINGMSRYFIQKCCVGGRCMSRKNKRYNIEKNLNDLDAVSLYPSAMIRLAEEVGGYLRGSPKMLEKSNYNLNYLKTIDGYFIKIRVINVPKERNFPLLSYMNKNGVRIFTNKLEEKIYEDGELVETIDHSIIYVDRIQLEDIIKYHKLTEEDFQILEGVYFDEGRNNKIGGIISNIFNKRLDFKKENNPAQELFKLIMNSAYGKTIMKEVNKVSSFYTNDEAFNQKFKRDYDNISLIEKYGENKYYVESEAKLYDHYNSCHIGCEILSMSKRIMNEVMCLAEDNKIEIYYQDTDSMHIENDKIESLRELFKKEYGRELIGKQTGQFHCDFDAMKISEAEKHLDGTPCFGNMVNASYSDKTIILGKKVYIDRVLHHFKNKEGEEKIYYRYHYRMKGQDARLIVSKSIKDYDNDIFKLYEDLYKGEEIEFNFTDVKVQFKADKLHRCITLQDFKRKISFKV